MTSSLAQQLAQSASLNSSLLVDRTRRKPTASYLFTAREADHHDLESIHALAVNAFFRLRTVEPALSAYEDALFSDAAKATDRTLQNAEANARLNASLNSFLPLLGPYLLETPTGKIIEWLVRRFRVHEFNVEAVLALFLPYQESPHFAKMLSILHISEKSAFAALLPYKSTSAPLTHNALVELMLKPTNTDLARFVGGLLLAAVKTPGVAGVHRALVAFHAGTLMDFVKRMRDLRAGPLDEGTLAWVLPAAVEPLQLCAELELESAKNAVVSEVVLSSYLLLSALAHTTPLAPKALSALLKTASACAARVSTKQLIRTLASICASQPAEAAAPLPKSVVKTVSRLPGVAEELCDALRFAGTERFVSPVAQALAGRLDDERAAEILTALVTYQAVPLSVVRALADALIEQMQVEDAESATRACARSLLVHIQQRHPETLQACFEAALKDAGENRDALEQLLISLSVDLSGGAEAAQDADMVVASTSADASVRVIAVRELYEKLEKGDLSSSELASTRSALLARVQDTHASIVEALYSKPAALLPLVLENPSEYLETVAQVLHAQATPSRTVIKAHLTFIAGHLYPAVAALPDAGTLTTAVFQHVFFPLLLHSKPRQRTAALVWEVIEASEELGRFELLGGAVDALRWEQAQKPAGAEDGYGATEALAKANVTLAAKIAENVVGSPAYAAHLEFLLERLNASDAHARALAYLVCRALLGNLSGERQVDVAHKIVNAMKLESLDKLEDFMRGSNDLQVFLHDASLSTAVVLKPNKLATFHRLQVAILALLSRISRPAGQLNWLAPAADGTSGAQYVTLARRLYALVNAGGAPPGLASNLVTALFVSIGDDALRFLAGLWLAPVAASVRYAALKHAAAFLEAHYSTERFVDFQTVLPALLVAVQFPERRLREAALECVAALVRLAQASSPSAVYAFDAIYGASSVDLQYLDWSDFNRYIQAVHASHEHLVNDASYLRILHQQQLLPVRSEPKKDAGYKQRVVCFLLAHVTSCALLPMQLALLRSLEQVAAPAKAQMLLPVAERFAAGELAGAGADAEALQGLVLAAFDATAADLLHERSDKPWNAYLKVVRHYFQNDAPAAARAVLATKLQSGLFAKLRVERKVELCKVLLEQGQEHADVASDCRVLLSAVLADVDVIIDLLSTLQPNVVDQRATKRAKVDSRSTGVYSLLSFLGEILGSKPLPGSLDLVSCLLETLSKVVHDTSSSSAEKTYAEQLLMSALENAAVNIPDGVSLSGANVRLDVLVELIRVSENPQTFNQALLLMATLTRLAPDAVLRNVMPIFTFMGSNVFHRDDTYSFRVVQKTIDGIVPVMANSLKTSHGDKLALAIASRSFLRIFTDAANHIPRHRRTHFFAHLADVLGPSDFLSPVCLLLVDKVSSKVVRQSSLDVVTTLALPLATLGRHSADVQFWTLAEMLQEAHRLINVELKLAPETSTFLEATPDEERGPHANTPKRQAHAILVFVCCALEQLAASSRAASPERATSSALLSTLLDMAVSKRAKLAEASMAHISRAADLAIRDALSVMSAADFLAGVLAVIETGEAAILEGVFNLLGDQLANVSEKVRQDSKASIIKIVDAIKKLLPTANAELLLPAALHALNTITNTLATGEEYALTSAVPLVIKSVRERRATAPALSTLLSLTSKLGPRTIPYFKEIVKECVGVLRDGELAASSDAIAVLQALLASIPNFWGSADLTQIVDLYLESTVSASQSLTALIWTVVKAVTKRIPSKVLLPVLCEYWTGLSTKGDIVAAKFHAFFTVLKRAVHAADRAVVADNLRPLMKAFLDAFQHCAASTEIKDEAQSEVIAAFLELVVKLNENVFKPLFRRLFDWAFTSDADDSRKVVFCQVYTALLDYFKNLMTPYMSFLLTPFTEMLNSWVKSDVDEDLWVATIQVIAKSFAHDEGAYWRDDRLRTLAAPIIAQVAVCTRLHAPDARTALSDCLVAMVEAVNDDSLVKKINLDILMHTRAEDARLRLYALTCSEALWRAHGTKLMGFAGETATFVAECAEDDNDSVVREAHKLKNVIEGVAGRIDV
ncbi:U3snoRNP10 and BP28CT domain-containing protein [Phanerochaete sordida]|uniref:U3 small nucleolar RNA-associated protein 10 n=1 Tax=Phanerochaete sordida TaxID=48140 RepID=A0A9P3GDR3_9APHY|nr:U3snoRNP10 and BP28CT domain-containing protein [Phanerochaete sordida]